MLFFGFISSRLFSHSPSIYIDPFFDLNIDAFCSCFIFYLIRCRRRRRCSRWCRRCERHESKTKRNDWHALDICAMRVGHVCAKSVRYRIHIRELQYWASSMWMRVENVRLCVGCVLVFAQMHDFSIRFRCHRVADIYFKPNTTDFYGNDIVFSPHILTEIDIVAFALVSLSVSAALFLSLFFSLTLTISVFLVCSHSLSVSVSALKFRFSSVFVEIESDQEVMTFSIPLDTENERIFLCYTFAAIF